MFLKKEKFKRKKKTMKECPCCSQPLLRSISKNKIYWFCSNCRQEMPDLETVLQEQQKKEHIAKLNRLYQGANLSLKSNV